MGLSLKKSACLLIAAVFVFSTAACGLVPVKKTETKTETVTSGTPSMVLVSDLSPQETVEKALDAMVRLDESVFDKYIVNDESSDDKIQFDNNILIWKDMAGEDKKLFTSIFSKFSYSILDSKEKEDTATVKVQITNRDLSDLFKQIVKEDPGKSDGNSFIIDLINKTDKLKQFDVDIPLKKEKEEWKMVLSKDLVNAISGGFFAGIDVDAVMKDKIPFLNK